MTTDTSAAIRAAAERILRNIDYTNYSAHCEQEDAAREIIHLLGEAEKDSVCQLEQPDNDIGFPHCSRCACMIQTIEMDSFGETVNVHDDFCPGCGRRIERGGEKSE